MAETWDGDYGADGKVVAWQVAEVTNETNLTEQLESPEISEQVVELSDKGREKGGSELAPPEW